MVVTIARIVVGLNLFVALALATAGCSADRERDAYPYAYEPSAYPSPNAPGVTYEPTPQSTLDAADAGAKNASDSDIAADSDADADAVVIPPHILEGMSMRMIIARVAIAEQAEMEPAAVIPDMAVGTYGLDEDDVASVLRSIQTQMQITFSKSAVREHVKRRGGDPTRLTAADISELIETAK